MFGTNCHFFPLAFAKVLTRFGCVNNSMTRIEFARRNERYLARSSDTVVHGTSRWSTRTEGGPAMRHATMFSGRRCGSTEASTPDVPEARPPGELVTYARSRCLAITERWTSLVPSPISQIFASRRCRSTLNSRV